MTIEPTVLLARLTRLLGLAVGDEMNEKGGKPAHGVIPGASWTSQSVSPNDARSTRPYWGRPWSRCSNATISLCQVTTYNDNLLIVDAVTSRDPIIVPADQQNRLSYAKWYNFSYSNNSAIQHKQIKSLFVEKYNVGI